MTERVVYGGQEVIGAARVEGPIVVVEGVDGVGYDEVAEVISGQECGMAFENYEDIREGDVIEIFEREEVERTLA